MASDLVKTWKRMDEVARNRTLAGMVREDRFEGVKELWPHLTEAERELWWDLRTGAATAQALEDARQWEEGEVGNQHLEDWE